MDDQIIYIEQKDKDNAIDLSRVFAIDETKRRAYVNALGAELAMKYLGLENIDISNVSNMHNIHKILEEFDISDVMLPNIHIDVRMIYNEEQIFIPKSHFEYGLTPDIYLVFHVTDNSPFVMFLGFFEPQMINKNNANDKYYFIEKEKLCSPKNLKSYVESFNGNTTQSLDEEELDNYRNIAISYIDENITKEDKENLIKVLTKSASLREELAEFSNFELLSYHTIKNKFFDEFDSIFESDDINLAYSDTESPMDEFDIFDTDDEFDKALAQETIDEELAGFNLSEDIDDSLLEYEDIPEEVSEDVQEDEITEPEPVTDENVNIEEQIDDEETPQDVQDDEINEPEQITDENNEIIEQETQEEIPQDIQENEISETEQVEEQEVLENVLEELDVKDILEEKQDLSIDENVTLNSEVENINDDIVNLDTLKAESTDVVKETPDNADRETTSLEALLNTPDNTYDEQDEISEIDLEDLEDILNNTEEINLEVIANKEQNTTDNIKKLEILYNEDNKSIAKNIDNQISNIITENENTKPTSKAISQTSATGKKAIAILAFIIVTIAGILLYTSFNKDNKLATQENANIMENNIPTDVKEQPIPENNVAEEVNVIPTPSPEIVIKPEQIKENITTQIKETPIDTPNLSVRKVGWAVPNYLSYNDKFAKYLQTAGKSLKLSLSSNLLLATEYAYSNEIEVNIKITKDGLLRDSSLTKSSGSDQIDGIVLQTVKDILNVVKAPGGVLVEDETNLILKLYL